MFRRPVQFCRLVYINYVMMKYGVDRLVLSNKSLSSWRFLSKLNPFNWFRGKDQTPGESVRLALQTLGPIFVKFGQTLSTRRDFIPDDIADELEKLVDDVPGFSGEQAKQIIEDEYGFTLSEAFSEFDLQPIASASISQVHKAKLLDGTQVAVKVLRPKIKRLIQRDIGLMYSVARLVQRFYSEGRRLKPVEVVAEFEKTIIDELDMMREGACASQLRRNFSDSNLLYVPQVYWDYTRDRVLVTEFITGIPITSVDALKASKLNMKKLADNGVEIFFTQVFRDSFFHADMHRGNIFIGTDDLNNPQYRAVDFGIMGVLSPTDQRYLAENLLAFFKRDYRQVAVLHVESGWVPPQTRVEEFEAAIRSVCEPIFEKPLGEISFGQLLLRLFQTASRFQMEIQPQLFLLQKTLLSIEGIGRQLYPQLDLWETAKPFLEKWLQQRIGAKALINNTLERAPFWAEKFTDVPDMFYKFLQQRTDAQPVQELEIVSPQPMRKTLSLTALGGVIIFISALHYYWIGENVQMRTMLTVGMGSVGAMLVVLGLVYR